MPAGDRVNVMQRVAVEFRARLSDGREQPEPGRRHPDLLPALADQRLVEALAVLDTPSDRVPVKWPGGLPCRTQSQQYLAAPADEKRPNGLRDPALHHEPSRRLP